ncbi:NAD-dependent epimerase/dehydratase family protein [Flagellimonas pelagia]|uniref:NAD-dependent epimerase/dehydratase family protein n=1 Tax=Flagellimonas pelagia TaxID=2306998 RepID=A0A3A1NP96_9FLAO|nr:NAD-dependent epimerase/dehydratase family protein [Allomuricauda maritima]RIV46901.1 NAD-dependent epimerase/dehydratase family protein [Allomuricauda maritima]TXJ99790.1 NAD-dependent epimerase/dehydratase family protein [Allomuricauda maritima]
MGLKIVLTGATGMVGEGVLMECLQNDEVSEILLVSRRHYPLKHTKVRELLIPDFLDIESHSEILKDYDACFYCAGVSSVGMNETEYTNITYDTTLHFAKTLSRLNPKMVFNFVTGSHTDSSEKGKLMWARVKGKTENDLMKLPFKGQYNFRPGFMKPFKEQQNVKWFFTPIIWVFPLLFPKRSLTLSEVGRAMINTASNGYSKKVLEISDIKLLGNEGY